MLCDASETNDDIVLAERCHGNRLWDDGSVLEDDIPQLLDGTAYNFQQTALTASGSVACAVVRVACNAAGIAELGLFQSRRTALVNRLARAGGHV
eukprot:3778665-Pyramimonas_sp.AAC.1